MQGAGWRNALAGLCALALLAGPAQAQIEGQPVPPPGGQLLPGGFFDQIPDIPSGQSSIEAESLAYNSRTQIVTASGQVVLRSGGYTAIGQRLVYDRKTGRLHFIGAVAVTAPDGTLYHGRDLEVTGGMKRGFYDALTITTPKGGRVTADSADYDKAYQTILDRGAYSPCGDCIDAKGRRIGWRVTTRRMIYDNRSKIITLDQPRLELLGVPVAWLPWLSMPDPTQKRSQGFEFPVVDYSKQLGARVKVPYFWAVSTDTQFLFTPTLMSRQGFLMQAEWKQNIPNGHFDVLASGIYQMDPSAFGAGVGNRRWRGAIQTSGSFVPAKHWRVGWSYSAFTDAGYFDDYNDNSLTASVNQVYGTYLTGDTYADMRIQRFNKLGDMVTADQQDQQALALPNARAEHFIDLGDGGQVDLKAHLLGLLREKDQRAATDGRRLYDIGIAEDKVHASFEADWQKQWIAPGGIVATPFLGLRGDVAYADTTRSTLDPTPGPTTLLSATPIAAMDIRFPMRATAGPVSQLIEPIAQLVWRGSDTSLVGITNDDAQSFVFDDTNLFSYNRFSGADLQETGLRANLGGRYQAMLPNGSWLNFTAGQSFQLAGPNAFGGLALTQAARDRAVAATPSYLVAGVDASPLPGLTLGAKTQFDPQSARLTRLGAAIAYTHQRFSVGGDYYYVAADPVTRGVVTDQNEIDGHLSIPVADYWTLTGGAGWDLSANKWLEAHAGLVYDDDYLRFGVHVAATGPTNTTPDDRRIVATFLLKTPDGRAFGF